MVTMTAADHIDDGLLFDPASDTPQIWVRFVK
jgi:hypothetical protein